MKNVKPDVCWWGCKSELALEVMFCVQWFDLVGFFLFFLFSGNI